MLSVMCCWCLCFSLCSISFAESATQEKSVNERPALTQKVIPAEKMAPKEKIDKGREKVESCEEHSTTKIVDLNDAYGTNLTPEQIAAKEQFAREIEAAANNNIESIKVRTFDNSLEEERKAGAEKLKDVLYNKNKKAAAEKLRIQKENKDLKFINNKKKAAKKVELEKERINLNLNQEKIDYYNSIKPGFTLDTEPGTGHNPNTVNPELPTSDTRTSVEFYFCTDSWAYESSFNVFASDGTAAYGEGYDASWIGNNACHSEFLDLADGDYTVTVYDSYGDGGLQMGVYAPGEGTYATISGWSGYDESASFSVPFVNACGETTVSLNISGGSYCSEITWDLSDGSSGAGCGDWEFCLADGDYIYSYTAGSWAGENSWTVDTADGAISAGAGADGGDVPSGTQGGHGGDGVQINFVGNSNYWGGGGGGFGGGGSGTGGNGGKGGGGGGSAGNGTSGTAGTNSYYSGQNATSTTGGDGGNVGGGGGACYWITASSDIAGDGGTGIVLVRYKI